MAADLSNSAGTSLDFEMSNPSEGAILRVQATLV
jgi:hypothetical protein